ncbi:hypothetical protein COCC4DRAFT_152462 [Bipolaris maydis ATCC 48331]|uniref:Uncharacterized protein n=2 Tax=Cochliobolus heterostrophus TaxID=5016 RepID=M2U6U7_COCH5|nr:uncharacterized protein COCC4DRAFT_152462 [Bipolaris maydis ATCC 48331]EMD89461.1 hypothetical protein COCHEDRAFT_1216187 [Bipolaris maydis C5]KAJ5025081.1 hypothetical protein J3E73DRAFT_392330 [Bipolaris maydis]ENH99716.1 hypothetical protein COCC4DRAFT_152462 [Bipolaris maydis ATCC 48331]KAJ5057309.1 hypothetical protein J3E74DRAFT_409994 [Bipolaris maydis]KAJ6194163.1 hypothetical protein J3E72DRAFT_377790 [Bipolaris maydis]
MSAFNWCWFDSAQTSVFAEPESQPVPLSVAVEASCTSSGFYDLFKLQKLLKPKNGKSTVFAVLTLLSAVSKSMMSNIIAYESFTVVQGNCNITLRLLNEKTDMFGFTLEQQLSLASRVSRLYTEFNIRSEIAQLFLDRSYVGVHATINSLNSIDSNITCLTGVRGFKLANNYTADLNSTILSLTIRQYSRQVMKTSIEDYKNPMPLKFEIFSQSNVDEILLGQNSTVFSPIRCFVAYSYGYPKQSSFSDVFFGVITRFQEVFVVPEQEFSSAERGAGPKQYLETVDGPIIPRIQNLTYQDAGAGTTRAYMGDQPQA